MHEIPLITTIALALSAALLFGLIARRLGLSPIVGYLIAGVLIGPYTPGVVGDAKVAVELAEIGVILLMFGVGLHFSLKELLAVRSLAIPGALAQSTAATLACMGLAVAIGWSWQSGLILGIAVSVASTVVMLRALLDHGIVETAEGHTAIGWLVVQDIVTVLVLVLVPAVAVAGGTSNIGHTVAIAVGKLALLIAIMMLGGARFVPWLLLRVARLRSAELFTLAVLVMAICVATVSYVAFGASMALGAFLGGMVVGQSKVSDQAGADVLPMRNVFTVLFFVSVGMLFDWRAVIAVPGLLIGVLGIILLVTPLLAFFIVIVSGHAVKTALTLAAGLAQIGEFSFIVAEMAKSLGLMPDSGHNVVVGAAIISISLNPLIFRWVLALGTEAFEIVLGCDRQRKTRRTRERYGDQTYAARSRRDRRRLWACRANRHALARGVRDQSHHHRDECRCCPRTSTAGKAGALWRRCATRHSARGPARCRGLPHRHGAARRHQPAYHPGRARGCATRANHHPRRVHQSIGGIRAGRRGHHSLRRSRIRRSPGGSFVAGHRRLGGANRRNC